MLLEKIYLVQEVNTGKIDLVAPVTIWACVGNSDTYDRNGTKIAGPISAYFAGLVFEGLRRFLEELGHQVEVESTADD